MEKFESYEKEYNGCVYSVEPAWKLVVDDYDEVLGSIELSHRESLGYNVVRVVDKKISVVDKEIDIIDYSWIDEMDVVDDKISDAVEKVILNSDNIQFSNFEGSKKIDFEIVITGSLLMIVKPLINFLRNNKDVVNKITFRGYESVHGTSAIIGLCKKYGVSASFVREDNKKSSKQYIYK